MTKADGNWTAGFANGVMGDDSSTERWRRVNAPHLVALVRAGATFVDGFIIEREDHRYAA
jgi:putative transposase